MNVVQLSQAEQESGGKDTPNILLIGEKNFEQYIN